MEYIKYRECDVCGREFGVRKSQPRQKRYCRECALKWQKINAVLTGQDHTKQCEICGATFVTRQPKQILCSAQCREKKRNLLFPRKVYEEEKTCDICGSIFKPTAYNQKRCSSKCSETVRYRYNSGSSKEEKQEFVPTLIPEITIKTTTYISGNLNTWHKPGFSENLKQQVKDRDQWECYICGKKTNLHVHHIVPRIEGGDHVAENLVTLCSGCHRSVESGNMEKAIQRCVERTMQNLGF